MFERMTIEEVVTSKEVLIAFTMLKPAGWIVREDEAWLAFSPKRRQHTGFAVLMPHKDWEPEGKLGENLASYLSEQIDELEPVDGCEDLDTRCPYDLFCFRGKIDGIDGRLLFIATSLLVEDVAFGLIGFSKDEDFHLEFPYFRTILNSFQPMVTASR